jgi:hypothetical protein
MKKQSKPPHPADISKVAEDIIRMKIKRTDTLNICAKKFFDIMRKHGIKQGTPSCNDKGEEVGIICDNFEWTMCKQLFLNRLSDFMNWEMIMTNIIPQDLKK